ncbi:inositol 2-dehydrogenase [Rhizosaccharibacter radicis]|uniref:Inositol 2-dehydrogenase n=1 Tax=Rhizosaccharibacter radicis TaxID=2782605 RepID=A0ABT1VSI7_9PROT|nr:inositol 2-dehydrogenase [Acetobacteraceae bacterium KSS12]
MISVALLGAGRIGALHARNLAAHPKAHFAALADAVPATAEKLGQELGVPVRGVDEILADPGIQAVMVCTSTDTHAELIERAAAANKAVFCEKPVDLSSERIRACLDRVSTSGAPLMIGFNRRFDPHLSELQRRLREGEAGEIEMVTILSRDPAPPPVSYIERSGGLFRDMMIHDFDMARFLLGEEPVEVHAVGSSLVDPAIGRAGDVDTAAVLLKTAAGRICQISCSRRSPYGYDQRIEVHGSKGMLRAHNIHTSTVELADAGGFRTAPVMDFFLERYTPAYRRELDHFLYCVASGAPPRPTGEDGLRAQMLADAATVAHQTGQPQRIPE